MTSSLPKRIIHGRLAQCYEQSSNSLCSVALDQASWALKRLGVSPVDADRRPSDVVGGGHLEAHAVQGKEVWLLRVKGVDSPEAADMLKGLRLLIRVTDRPPLDSEEEFYVQELIGMQVGTIMLGLHPESCMHVVAGCLHIGSA